MSDTMTITATQDQLAAAFTEWDRRYRDEPERFYSEGERPYRDEAERFYSEAQHLLQGTPETYGEACAPYLMSIIEEQSNVQVIEDVQLLSTNQTGEPAFIEGEGGSKVEP